MNLSGVGREILLAEDDDSLREIINDFFTSDGFNVMEAMDGNEAMAAIAQKRFDLALLDIMLPYIDGFTLCRRIRKEIDVPVIIITARSDDEDKLLGYELGADDYITKPFNPKVLLAKAKNLIRRANKNILGTDGDITAGSITINPLTYIVTVSGERVELPPKEFDLLLALMRNKNRVMSRDMLLSKVWGYDYYGDTRTVDTHIKLLRGRLRQGAAHIVTQMKVGYKFDENIQDV